MRSDTNHLTEGINILIATLDRLLDHLQNTGSFKYKELKVKTFSLVSFFPNS
jgi:superfamily II DNA/RNA helicase